MIRHAAALEQPPYFLALSVSDAAEDVIAVIRAGARGWPKASGGRSSPTWSGPWRAATPSSPPPAELRTRRPSPAPRQPGSELDALTPREREVLSTSRAATHVQGDRAAARHLPEEHGGARVVGAAQAPALEPPRARAGQLAGDGPRRPASPGRAQRSDIAHSISRLVSRSAELRRCRTCPCPSRAQAQPAREPVEK